VGARRSAQPPPQEQTGPQAEIAVAFVGAVGLSRAAFVVAIAPLLLPLMPGALLTRPGEAAEVAESAARLLYEADAVPVPSSGFGRTAAMEAISYRAAYAREAVRRLSRALLDAEPGSRGEALRKALEAERRHLDAHVEMTRKRLAGAKVTDAMIELHGWVLNWAHGVTRAPEEFRQTHKAADGMNVDLRRGIPVSVMAVPGVLLGCSCAWRPPKPGARMLI
jgi:hypothetical protein